MTRRGVAAIAATVALLVTAHTGVARAAWAPGSSPWPTFRGDTTNSGFRPGSSLFTPGAGGFSRVKWEQSIQYPTMGPVSVADLNADGVPDVVVPSSDVKVQVTLPPSISFNHKVEARRGDTGALLWQQDEGNSFAFNFGANAANIDADDQGEVTYFVGNPLTGTSADSGLMARSHTGAQQWRFSDAAEWGNTQHPVGILTGIHSADVDAEATFAETVFGVNLADFTIQLIPGGPDCPGTNQKIGITASNIKHVVHALNGEGASASNSWKRRIDPGGLFSTPVIHDLNGDGRSDVVWGSGAPAGPILPGCEVEVTTDQSAVDNRVIAVNGANPPNALWEKALFDPPGVPRPPSATPVVAGTTAGGDPILVFLIPVANFEPVANDPDRSIMLALNGRTGDELWRKNLRPATPAPLAAGDLDGDGRQEVVVQIADRIATFDSRTGADFWATQGTGDQAGVVYDRLLTSTGLAIGDLDSDGIPEIAALLEGSRVAGEPKGELLVVSGADGSVQWTRELIQDVAVGGPVIADVDGDDDLLEIVVATGIFTVTDSPAHTGRVIVLEPNAPDLTVDNLTVVGSQVVGEPQTVRAVVRNAGQRDASGVAVRVRDGSTDVGTQTVSLAAGASTTLDFPWTPASFGNHSLNAAADSAASVREGNETNNERSATVRIKVGPDASFSFSPTDPTEVQSVQFTDTSTDPDGQALSRQWTCTDGFSSTQANPSHAFADGDSYECTLTVTDTDGLSDTTSTTITVAHVAPVANFTAEVADPGRVQFSDTSTHPKSGDAPPTGWSYAWDLDGDGTLDSTARNPFHDYGVEEGEFDVELRVTDNDGLTSATVKRIDVGLVNLPPDANFAGPATSCVQDWPCDFVDQSGDADGHVVRIEADFGDGTTPSVVEGGNVAGSTIRHTYVSGGDFTVTWTVTDNRGATATRAKQVHVCVPPGALVVGPGFMVHFEFCQPVST
jgi:PKD repeat protein